MRVVSTISAMKYGETYPDSSSTMATVSVSLCPWTAATETAPEVILVTDQNDVESLANESFMMAAHQHDYWGGKDRLVVMDAGLENDGCCVTIGPRGFALQFVPADGIVVPHGTKQVEVIVTWTDEGTQLYEDPELWVQTAAEHEPSLVAPLSSGVPLVIGTEDHDLDLPHQSLSAWRFVVRVYPMADGVVARRVDGTMTVHAEAIRGREIPIYPPHPDLWGSRETIPLFEDEAAHALWRGQLDEDGRDISCYQGCFPRIHRPANGTVVPFDAATIEVILDARPDPTFEFGLKFHGADTRNFTDLVPTTIDGTKRVYEIPLSPGLGDSPYATQSVWGFAVFSEKPERDGTYAGSYTLTARAIRVV